MLHNFLNSRARSWYLSFFSLSISFNLCSASTAKSTIFQVLYFCWLLLGLVFWPRLGDPFLCQSPIGFCASGLCIYHLFVWSNFNFLYISQWISLPTQSHLVLYSFCANLLHSLIIWLLFNFQLYFRFLHQAMGQMNRVFTSSPGDGGRVIPKTQKWYLIPSCLTFSIIRYGSRVKWSNPGNGVVPSPTPLCSGYWKVSLRVTLD